MNKKQFKYFTDKIINESFGEKKGPPLYLLVFKRFSRKMPEIYQVAGLAEDLAIEYEALSASSSAMKEIEWLRIYTLADFTFPDKDKLSLGYNKKKYIDDKKTGHNKKRPRKDYDLGVDYDMDA